VDGAVGNGVADTEGEGWGDPGTVGDTDGVGVASGVAGPVAVGVGDADSGGVGVTEGEGDTAVKEAV
jgi:hypothetical protein